MASHIIFEIECEIGTHSIISDAWILGNVNEDILLFSPNVYLDVTINLFTKP
jgi:hypothetical protein